MELGEAGEELAAAVAEAEVAEEDARCVAGDGGGGEEEAVGI